MINTLRLTHLIYLIYLGWVGLHVSVYKNHLQAHLRIVFLQLLATYWDPAMCIIAEQSVLRTNSSPVATPPPYIPWPPVYPSPYQTCTPPWRRSFPDLWTVPLQWLGNGMDDRGIVVRFLAGTRDSCHFQKSRRALGSTQPSIQWVTGL